MKLNKSSLRLFFIFALFALIIFTLLFLMQTVFLQKFFDSKIIDFSSQTKIEQPSEKKQFQQTEEWDKNNWKKENEYQDQDEHKGLHNPYLQNEYLLRTKTVLRLQLLTVTLISFILAFVFTLIFSRRISDEKIHKARMELLSNITHDLRTPLTLIKGYAENLQEFTWQKQEERNHDTQIIIRESDRLSALVNDILEYSSVQEEKLSIKKENFDLSILAGEVINQFGSEKITASLEKNCFINAGKSEIERVLYNFIDNAQRHCDARGVTVTTEKNGSKIMLKVQNYGNLIPKENIEFIWDRYFTARQRRASGTKSGLGLAIAKEILEGHSASYGVSSDEKNGTVFWFSM